MYFSYLFNLEKNRSSAHFYEDLFQITFSRIVPIYLIKLL